MVSSHIVVPCRNELGEGIVWDEVTSRFWWTDIQRYNLWSAQADGSDLLQCRLPERLASFALTNRDGVFLAAFDRGIATYSVHNSQIDWLCRPDLPPGVRFNDGRTDRNGRFVVGTMVEDADAAGGRNMAGLYRFESDHSLTLLFGGISISNALCFSLDGTQLYHADTPSGEVCAYSYKTGIPSARKVIARYNGSEGPDGACVDAGGNIWVAIWGGARVDCLSPDGIKKDQILLEAKQPTCPAFGGPDLGVMAVTSAWQGLAHGPDQRPKAAGDMFLVSKNFAGIAEMRVQI